MIPSPPSAPFHDVDKERALERKVFAISVAIILAIGVYGLVMGYLFGAIILLASVVALMVGQVARTAPPQTPFNPNGLLMRPTRTDGALARMLTTNRGTALIMLVLGGVMVAFNLLM